MDCSPPPTQHCGCMAALAIRPQLFNAPITPLKSANVAPLHIQSGALHSRCGAQLHYKADGALVALRDNKVSPICGE